MSETFQLYKSYDKDSDDSDLEEEEGSDLDEEENEPIEEKLNDQASKSQKKNESKDDTKLEKKDTDLLDSDRDDDNSLDERNDKETDLSGDNSLNDSNTDTKNANELQKESSILEDSKVDTSKEEDEEELKRSISTEMILRGFKSIDEANKAIASKVTTIQEFTDMLHTIESTCVGEYAVIAEVIELIFL